MDALTFLESWVFLFFFVKKKANRLKHQFFPMSVWPQSATPILAKVGQLRLAKVGQNFLAKVGFATVGISRLGVSPSDFSANHTRSCMMWPESPPRFRSLWVVWDSLPQPGRGRGLTGQVRLIASQWCTSVTPQWQRPWCKGWSGTHFRVLRLSERVWHT